MGDGVYGDDGARGGGHDGDDHGGDDHGGDGSHSVDRSPSDCHKRFVTHKPDNFRGRSDAYNLLILNT
jgi:hypothetical protein